MIHLPSALGDTDDLLNEIDASLPPSTPTRQDLRFECPPQPRSYGAKDGPTRYTYIVPLDGGILEKLKLPDTVTLPVGVFQRKKEFHVTAIGFALAKLIEQKLDRLEEDGRRALVQRIGQLLSQADFSCVIHPQTVLIHNLDYDPEAVRRQEGPAAFESEYTIAVNVDMPGMAQFYEKMRQELNIDLGKPCTHITLYIKRLFQKCHAAAFCLMRR